MFDVEAARKLAAEWHRWPHRALLDACDEVERLAQLAGFWEDRAAKRVSEMERLLAAGDALAEALRLIEASGGWKTEWRVDEAEPERGEQPTITNEAGEIARAALAAWKEARDG